MDAVNGSQACKKSHLEGIVCLESIGVGCSRAPRPPRGIDIVDRISHIQQDGTIYTGNTHATPTRPHVYRPGAMREHMAAQMQGRGVCGKSRWL